MLRKFYPWLIKLQSKKAIHLENKELTQPQVSIYELSTFQGNGQQLSLQAFMGKKLIIVNTASDCGYTAQYASLQRLFELYSNKIVILAFPSNDFKEQERGTDAAIEKFCEINYGLTFSLMQKTKVVKGTGQHQIFEWLSNSLKNGWNPHAPEWNFCKYIIDEQGRLSHYFNQNIDPSDARFLKALQ